METDIREPWIAFMKSREEIELDDGDKIVSHILYYVTLTIAPKSGLRVVGKNRLKELSNGDCILITIPVDYHRRREELHCILFDC